LVRFRLAVVIDIGIESVNGFAASTLELGKKLME